MNGANSIKNWLEYDRPREKMLQKGASALTDAELLAILISSGTKEKSALALAKEVLALANNNLQELGKLTIEEFTKIKGIGEARAITIASCLELGRRRRMSEGLQRSNISGSRAAAEIILPLLQDLNHEAFCVLYLNNASSMIRHELISSGGLTSTVADARMILKNALLYNSNQLIIAHNHPSGVLRPSHSDRMLTDSLKQAAAFMDIKLVDHLIIADGKFFSFCDEGLL